MSAVEQAPVAKKKVVKTVKKTEQAVDVTSVTPVVEAPAKPTEPKVKAAKAPKAQAAPAPAPAPATTETPAGSKPAKRSSTERYDDVIQLFLDKFTPDDEFMRAFNRQIPNVSRHHKKRDQPVDANGNPVKAAQSAYMIFGNEFRQSKPGQTVMVKEISAAWRAISPSERARIDELARKDRERFNSQHVVVPKKKKNEDSPDHIYDENTKKYIAKSGKRGQQLVAEAAARG